MSVSCGTPTVPERRRGERGEGRLKFLMLLAVLALVAYSGYQYVPIAIQAYQFKDLMQQTVNTAAMQPQTADGLRKTHTSATSSRTSPYSTRLTPSSPPTCAR